jgi:hypothetical protein
MRALGTVWAPLAAAAACLTLMACGSGKGGDSSRSSTGGIAAGPTVGVGTTARPVAARLEADP